MKLVVVESPFKGDGSRSYADNAIYARLALADCLARGEAPLASHLLYPQVLSDAVPDQRMQGIQAGLAWADRADLAVFYIDHGESEGMRQAREFYDAKGIPIEYRKIVPPAAAPDGKCPSCSGVGRVAGIGCAPCGGTGRRA